jgi:hypothetical protein
MKQLHVRLHAPSWSIFSLHSRFEDLEALEMKTFREWMSEGETIYAEAMSEYQTLETQIAALESRLSEKKNEVNQIAQLIGKPPVEGSKRLTAQLVDHEAMPASVVGSVTRALTGRGIVAR